MPESMSDTEIDIESWEELMYADGKVSASELRALRDAIKWTADSLLEKFNDESKAGAGKLLLALHKTSGAAYNAVVKILQLADSELSLGEPESSTQVSPLARLSVNWSSAMLTDAVQLSAVFGTKPALAST